MFTPAERDRVLERAVELVKQDSRVEASFLTGSLGRGAGDEWSDIDLQAVVAEGVDVASVAADWDALAYREWPVAHHYATAFGETLVRGYLLQNALLLDMGFTPRRRALGVGSGSRALRSDRPYDGHRRQPGVLVSHPGSRWRGRLRGP